MRVWSAMVGIALGAIPACDREREPEGFQGIVEHTESVLSFEVGGRVVELPARRGARAQADEVLAIVDDTMARTAFAGREAEAQAAKARAQLVRAGSRVEDIRAAEAQLRAARATEAVARKDLERDRELLRKQAIPRADFDQTEARQRTATSERQSLEQRLRELETGARTEEVEIVMWQASEAEAAVQLEAQRTERYRLQALDAGTITDVHVERGEVVSAGTPVVTMADTTHPYVDVFVPQAQLGGIRVGAAAAVRVDALDRALDGSVEDIARRTEFTPRYLFSERERATLVVRVRVRVDDRDAVLHAGVPAFVTIERNGVVVAP